MAPEAGRRRSGVSPTDKRAGAGVSPDLPCHVRAGACALLLVLAALVRAATAQTTLVSVANREGELIEVPLGGDSLSPSVSTEGRFVAFHSGAVDLVAGDTNDMPDVFVRDRATGVTTRDSVGPGGAQATGPSGNPSLSADGRYVAFESTAANLVAGDTNGISDVFVRDRATGITTRVSVATGGGEATSANTNGSYSAAISPDGRFIAFDSFATNLVAGDTNGQRDVFLHDRSTGQTTRVSVASAGGQAIGGASYSPAVSADGRYVAFISEAANVVAGDTNAAADAFVHDRATGQTTRVSVTSGGGQATASGYVANSPGISADGRYVAFQSAAADLVPSDTNGVVDAFVHDRVTVTTTRVSVTSAGGQANGGGSGTVRLSADSRYVAFSSSATNLVTNDTNAAFDVFLHDRTTGQTTRVSVDESGAQANGGSGQSAISADGRFVAFNSAATNLVIGDINARSDMFLRDTRAFQRERVSVSSAGDQGNGPSQYASLSADGRFVAFISKATNLVPGDTNPNDDVFVRDRAAGTTTRVSVPIAGSVPADSFAPSLSADGRYVAFASNAVLVVGDTNGTTDVYVHDRETGDTSRVSVPSGGAGQGTGSSADAWISADGRYVAFTSQSPNLVFGDTNAVQDVFVHDRVTKVTSRESVSTGGGQPTGASYMPRLSADGRYVVFSSGAPDLVSGDVNPLFDVFVRDRLTGETSVASLTDAGSQASGDNDNGSISDDGQYVVFTSTSDNVVAGDTGGWRDVFLRDRVTSRTFRISVASDGAQPNQASTAPRMSAGGRYVVFRSDATNLVAGDSNGKPDLFVRDRLTNLTTRVSVGADNAPGDVNDFGAAISHDGGVIAFSSLADTLVPGDTNVVSDVFVRAATPTVARLTPRTGSTTGGTTLRIDGTRFLDGTTATIGGETSAGGRSRGQLSVTTPAGGPGLSSLSINVPGYAPYTIPFAYTFVTPGPPGTDTDGDGMPDASEAFYGLDLADPRDGTHDDDGDGMSNADEVTAGRHPRGVVKSYLAEGATSSFFATELALVNYGESPATALLSVPDGQGGDLHPAAQGSAAVPRHHRRRQRPGARARRSSRPCSTSDDPWCSTARCAGTPRAMAATARPASRVALDHLVPRRGRDALGLRVSSTCCRTRSRPRPPRR